MRQVQGCKIFVLGALYLSQSNENLFQDIQMGGDRLSGIIRSGSSRLSVYPRVCDASDGYPWRGKSLRGEVAFLVAHLGVTR